MDKLGIFLCIIWFWYLLERKIKELTKRISKLEEDVYDLKNPPKDYNSL